MKYEICKNCNRIKFHDNLGGIVMKENCGCKPHWDPRVGRRQRYLWTDE